MLVMQPDTLLVRTAIARLLQDCTAHEVIGHLQSMLTTALEDPEQARRMVTRAAERTCHVHCTLGYQHRGTCYDSYRGVEL